MQRLCFHAIVTIPFALLIVWGMTFFPLKQEQPPAAIGGAFSLTDTHGKRMSDKDFNGKLSLVYLGYVHCPDVCPTTLGMLSDVLQQLGSDAGKVEVIFITVDAKRDTPQALGDFLKAFDPAIIGLTGSAEELQQVVELYKAYVSAPPNPMPGNNLIEHSGFLYLMGRDGHYLRHFQNGVKAHDVLAAVKDAL